MNLANGSYMVVRAISDTSSSNFNQLKFVNVLNKRGVVCFEHRLNIHILVD